MRWAFLGEMGQYSLLDNFQQRLALGEKDDETTISKLFKFTQDAISTKAIKKVKGQDFHVICRNDEEQQHEN